MPVLVKMAAVNKTMYVAVGVARSTAEGIIIDDAGTGTSATPLTIRNHLGDPHRLRYTRRPRMA